MSGFVDYFFVSGLNPDCELEQNNLNDENCDSLVPLERSYGAHLLQCEPQCDKTETDGFVMLSLPKGICFTMQRKPGPEFHSFVLTSATGERTYGFSLMFDEPVVDMRILNALQALQTMFVAELAAVSRQSPAAASASLLVRRSLPRNFKVAKFSRGKSPTTAHGNPLFYDRHTDQLFVNKAISIVSRFNYVQIARMVLLRLHELLSSTDNFESYLHQFRTKFRIPEPGFSLLVDLTCPVLTTGTTTAAAAATITIVNEDPHRFELEHFDYPIGRLFELLGIKTVLKLFACCLLEMQILLESRSYDALMLVAESITCLLYPFKWTHVYVPILSQQMYRYVDAPVPYLMGICVGDPCTSAAFAHQHQRMCRVRIDDACIECSQSIPTLPYADHLRLELEKVFDHNKVDVSAAEAAAAVTRNIPVAPIHLSLPHESALRRRQRQTDRNVLAAIRTADCDPPSPPGSASLHSLRAIGNLIERSRPKLSLLPGPNGQTAAATQTVHDQYTGDMKLNNAIRHVFLNLFVNWFYNYESFMLPTSAETGGSPTVEIFDKVAFMTDLPSELDPFLRRFVNTQMFANFALSRQSIAKSGDLFDRECGRAMHRSKEMRGYKPCTIIHETERALDEKYSRPDFEVRPFNESIDFRANQQQIDESCDRRPISESGRSPNERLAKNFRDQNRALMLKFVKDCKIKTKRIVLNKLHDEGIETAKLSGSGSGFYGVIEENSQIVSLCDFLERVWSHGIRQKLTKSSSALWSCLTTYEKRQMAVASGDTMPVSKPVRFTKPAMELIGGGRATKQLLTRPASSLLYDLRNVRSLTDIKTELGFARAWIRLALEKKRLAQSMEMLLSDRDLLRLLYKDTAFVRFRSEGTDEDDLIEQFLLHLCSLNTVDFYTFTQGYRGAMVPYQIAVRFGDSEWSTDDDDDDDDDDETDSDDDYDVPDSMPLWLQLNGSFYNSKPIKFFAGQQTFMVRLQNLGLLSSLQIGLRTDDTATAISNSIRIRAVYVRDEITGRVTQFPCHRRRLGHTAQRLLVTADNTDGATQPIHVPDSLPTAQQLKTDLGDVSNRILKWFAWNRHRSATMPQNALIALVHGPKTGLVVCLRACFQFGFRQKSIGLFRIRNYTLWMFLVLHRDYLNNSTIKTTKAKVSKSGQPLSVYNRNYGMTRKYFVRVVDEIVAKANDLADDDKFRLFLTLAVRDKRLDAIVERVLLDSESVRDFYDANLSFVRNRDLAGFLVQILQKLNGVEFTFNGSITHGIESIQM